MDKTIKSFSRSQVSRVLPFGKLFPSFFRAMSSLLLLSLSGIFVGGWAALWLTLTRLGPFGADAALAQALLWSSAGLALFSSFALVLSLFRGWRATTAEILRPAFILTLLVLGLLFLQHLGVLTWWDGGLLLVIAIFAEFLLTQRGT